MLCSIERLAPRHLRRGKGQYQARLRQCGPVQRPDLQHAGHLRGISTPLLFAIARVPGWCAHRVEEVVFANRIIRPAYKYLGVRQKYKPIEER